MEMPPVDSYHPPPETINRERCIGRKTGDEDKRWRPHTHHAKQCGKIKHLYDDLCEECNNLELVKVIKTKYISKKTNKKKTNKIITKTQYWNGRVTDGYETIHIDSAIAGGYKFYDKHKWIESGLGPVRQVQHTEITRRGFQEFIHE